MRRLFVLAGVVALLLTGCSPIVALDRADDGINAACASVVVHIPDTVDSQPKRETNAQGTGAWGTPTNVILRCGVAVPGPTAALPCVTAGGVDWLLDDKDAPTYVYTTYGHDPAIEVIVDQNAATPGIALRDLGSAVSYSPENGHKCVGVTDSLD
jgi:uncharacterized protein YceK